MIPIRLDPSTAEFRAGAHPFYARLREESPVLPIRMPNGPAWLVTRYADVEAGLKDDRLGKDPRAAGVRPDFATRLARMTPLRAFDRNMLDRDPPDHTRLRKLVHRAFTARRIADLEARVDRLAEELLAPVPADRGMEVVAGYALPIPMTVICELLGIPEADHGRVRRWTEIMVSTSPTAARCW